MADQRLLDLINDDLPSLNDTIVNGYAVKEMRMAERYVEEIMECAQESFPPGLTYEGSRRLPPHVEYLRATESRSGKPTIDVSRSDRFMVEYSFKYLGETITKDIYLPFVRDGGLINLKGATFAISPVLADRGVSFGTNSAFVNPLRSKMTFTRHIYHFFAGTNRVEKVYVVSGKLHHRSRKKAKENGAPGMNEANTTNLHYLLGKYGLHQTFASFNDTQVVVGSPAEVNELNYPLEYVDEETGEVEDGWVVCQSIGHRPKAIKNRNWQPPHIRIAVRVDDFCDSVIRSLIGGFFYIADLFPERMDQLAPEELDGSEDEIRFWRILLGKIIGGVSGGDGEVVRDMNDHYNSLDYYIDKKTQRNLEKGDIFVDDIYELIGHLQEVLCQNTIQSISEISSMENKQLMVLRYVLSDINSKIFWMLFKLHNKVSQGKGLTISDVRKTLRNQLSTEIIMRLRNGSQHSEVTSVSLPGDNKYFKITRNVVLQTDSGGGGRRNKKMTIDESKYLHASQLEYGSATVLPKSEPTGKGSINPTVQVDEEGNLVGRKEFAPILENIQELIARR